MAKARKSKGGEEVKRTPRCPQQSGKEVTVLGSDICSGRTRGEGEKKMGGDGRGKDEWCELKVGLGKAKESWEQSCSEV